MAYAGWVCKPVGLVFSVGFPEILLPQVWFLYMEGWFLSEKLWETCREAKDTMQPHKTNQDIADESGVSVNAVSQFLRGETTKPYIDTVGPICASLGVSLDEHFGVPPADPAEPSDTEKLLAENAALRAQFAQQQKSLHMHRLVTLILLGILLLCALALVADVLIPSIGWIRT